MAESIYTILDNGKTDTAVKNFGDQEMFLPDYMPSSDEFASEELLIEWARENGLLHAGLQKGVQKHLIDLRAAYRAVKKGKKWNIKTAQRNVDTYEWAVYERPKSKGQAEIAAAKAEAHIKAGTDMARAMRSGGIGDDAIKAALENVYETVVAEAIMVTLDGENSPK